MTKEEKNVYHIKLLNKISSIGTDVFDKEKYTYSEAEENPDAILVRSASLHEMKFGENLKCIARAGAGINNIPVEKCSEKGIVVFNTPGANANAVKELTMAALLLASRKITEGIAWVNSLKGQCDDVAKEVEKGKSAFLGPELYGKKLGVIGLGAIGAMVANTAYHFGMEVMGFDPYMTIDNAWSLSRAIKKAQSREEIYAQCDYITIHVPSTPETRGMICESTIHQMKDGVRIVNLARGDLVVNKDVIAAVGQGKIGAYVTDFPCGELLGVPGIVTIPHLGATTPESEDNCALMAVKECMAFLEQGNIKNSVNYPEVILPHTGNFRLCIFHKNIPSMLSQVSSVVSDMKINIENMINKSKKDNAYTIIETNDEITESAIEKIRSIQGIVRVNLIQ